MSKINLKEIEQVAVELNHDMEEVRKELRKIQSIKCRLKKQKNKPSYETDMTKVLKREQILKEVRNLINPREKFVTEFDQDDVNQLDYDETMKAIKSIQSKKTLSKYLTVNAGDNDEYRNAVRIEEMLLKHKQEVQPVDDEHVRKSDVETIIDTIESSGKLSQEQVVELLKKLV